MSKSISIVDIIKASPGNAPVVSQDKVAYDVSRTLAEFDNLDLITKEAALTLPGALMYVLPAIPAGTVIPYFIDISLYPGVTVNSDIITKATSYNPSTGVATGRLQRWSDILIEDQDTNSDGTGTFTGWNIYGHDDGTGNFKEDTYIIIKG